MRIGIVGGTGLYQLLDSAREERVATPYGEVSLYHGAHRDLEVAFLPRHGLGHGLLAYQVNYRANMMALNQVGVERILSNSAVGSMNPEMKGGDLVLLDQFVDFCKRRESTYGEISVDMTEPYCRELRSVFLKAAGRLGVSVHPRANYICVDGPRYETPAEIAVYRQWGMDVVGMTNATEAALARELGMCYSVLAMVTNLIGSDPGASPDLKAHKQLVETNRARLAQILLEAITLVPEEKSCSCEAAYRRAVAARRG